jgi:hypothetical protein
MIPYLALASATEHSDTARYLATPIFGGTDLPMRKHLPGFSDGLYMDRVPEAR